MQRFTISIDDTLAEEFDRFVAERGYDNRSEAVRDLLRQHLDRHSEREEPDSPCVASLSYVYNHHEHQLAERLTRLHHEHHDLGVATMHAHLDHEHCLETVLLRGPAQRVRRLAWAVTAERGVRHGALNLVMTEAGQRHRHADGTVHSHERPRF